MKSVNLESTPVGEKYYGAKFLALFSIVAGDRGEMGCGIYEYMRWLDNIVDDPSTEIDKKQLLQQSMRLIAVASEGEDFLESGNDERVCKLIKLPWKSYQELGRKNIVKHAQDIMRTMQVDVEHMDLTAKSKTENSEYAVFLLTAALGLAGSIFDSRELDLSDPKFQKLMYAWFVVASLHDLQDDLATGLLHIPLEPDETDAINSLENVGDRRRKITEIIDEERFVEIKSKYLAELLKNGFAFFAVGGMPLWQKVLSTIYNYQGYINHRYIKKFEPLVN